jgi:ferredoxin
MGYLADLGQVAWADKVHLHITDEDTRADLGRVMAKLPKGAHVYTCGADRYMSAVMAAVETAGVPEDARHLEYFSVPEVPAYENFDFTLRLARSGRDLLVPADKTATDVLAENGIHVDVKCSDGICGVCKCGLVSGDVEHRDFVLSKAQRKDAIILCQSRAVQAGGVIEIDL